MSDTTQNELYIRAALEWMNENTTISVDPEKPEALVELPARAQLFVEKYTELLRRTTGLTSQSIEGLSQSFDGGSDVGASVWKMARALLRGDLKSQVRVFPAKRRW